MIKIEVEDYCQRCLDFNPDVTKPTRYFDDRSKEVSGVQTDTIIQCEYRKRCAGIRRYLEQQMKGETL